MARLTEEMVIARSRQSDLSSIKKLNCWGAELGDVSLLRRMPNVEVLAFSINKIRSLEDFAGCRNLRELYVRKNEIRDLREIRHLRRLPALTSLWLDENPCTRHPEYRMTVLRNLPSLEKLDNVPVQPDELQDAMRRGSLIPDSDDEGYSQPQEAYAESVRSGGSGEGGGGGRRARRSCESSPDREEPYRDREQGSDSSEGVAPEPDRPEPQRPLAPQPRAPPDARLDHPAMTRSHYDAGRARADPPLRHSVSAHSVKHKPEDVEERGLLIQEYAYSTNGDCRYHPASPPHAEPYYERGDRYYYHPASPPHAEPYYERGDSSRSEYGGAPSSAREWERDRDRDNSARERDRGEREYPSAVMGEHRGFTRRPVTRNSNLLSALLCLVKELDYPSLEVAEMAVRCRMDELANSQ